MIAKTPSPFVIDFRYVNNSLLYSNTGVVEYYIVLVFLMLFVF